MTGHNRERGTSGSINDIKNYLSGRRRMIDNGLAVHLLVIVRVLLLASHRLQRSDGEGDSGLSGYGGHLLDVASHAGHVVSHFVDGNRGFSERGTRWRPPVDGLRAVSASNYAKI